MNNMLIAIQISALGMGLVFGAIVLLWGMMNLLTSLTADKEPASSSTEASPKSIPAAVVNEDFRAQAAAVAVVTALAEQQDSTAHVFTEPPSVIVSAWQLGMRTRQMYQKGSSMRQRTRQNDK
jgi:Na+-transporting methylmalonyl-CoA/oxaloacetate decarboxylase gamma subunit